MEHATPLTLTVSPAARRIAPSHPLPRREGRTGLPVQNTTEDELADRCVLVYAGLAVGLLIFALAHRFGVL